MQDDFPGKTSHGIAIGDQKTLVSDRLGEPWRAGNGFDWFDGLTVRYDAKARVKSMSVLAENAAPPGDEPP